MSNNIKRNKQPNTKQQSNTRKEQPDMGSNKPTKKHSWMNIATNLAIVGIVAFAVFTYVLPTLPFFNNSNKKQENHVVEATIQDNGDMVMNLADISSEATFYQYDHEDAHLEVFAIVASDGSIRTAFNTCQVCYASGRGYYIQDGEYLVCQNCGNQFHRDMVEVTKGGCNPVPIFDTDKTTTSTEIVISATYLSDAAGLFANWSRN